MSASDMGTHDKEVKKQLNKEARQIMKEAIHEKEGLIVHRPALQGKTREAHELQMQVMPIIESPNRQILELLGNEQTEAYQKGKYEGQWFSTSRIAYSDLRNFGKKSLPHEQSSLTVAVRIDEPGSVIRNNRIEAAKKAAIAVAEFARRVGIPLLVCGDTAGRLTREETSLFPYEEFGNGSQWLGEKLVTMKPRQNDRDGATLRLTAEKLNRQSVTAKLLLGISDGQPETLPDYTGKKVKEDIQSVLKGYEHQGILFVSAATDQDKEEIKSIYSESRLVDITDLNEFPKRMIQLIARYLR